MAGDTTALTVALLALSGGSSLPTPSVTLTPSATSLLAEWGAVADAISYDVHVREVGAETWDEVATGVVGLSQTVADLDPETSYQVRVTANLTVTTEAVASGTTLEALYLEARYITAAYQDSTAALTDLRCFAQVITNRGPAPVTHIQLWGRNYISNHRPYLGAWVIGGTLNLSTYQGTTHQRITFSNGANTFTPPNGSVSTPAFWRSDKIALDTPIPVGASRVIRIQCDTGSYATSLAYKTGARPNFSDLGNVAMANTAGDFGSSLATVQTNPGSWNAGINGVIGGVMLEGPAVSNTRRAIVFGDSIICGFIDNNAARDTWVDAANDAMGAGYDVVSSGCGGYLIQDSAGNATAFMGSPMAADFETIVLSAVSWNNRLQPNSSTAQNALNTAIAAIQAAGKRVVLWIPVPACVSGGSARWDEMLAWARARGLPLIETWTAVADGGVGPMLVAAYTGDNVHLRQAGQLVQGAGLGAQRTVLFP